MIVERLIVKFLLLLSGKLPLLRLLLEEAFKGIVLVLELGKVTSAILEFDVGSLFNLTVQV